MHMRRFATERANRLGTLLLGTGLAGLAPPAHAQTAPAAPAAAPTTAAAPAPDDGRIADVVVTAQRRDQRLQDVPISMSAVSVEALETSGIRTTADLYRAVPSLSLNTTNGRFFPRIRGIGNDITNPAYENGVATYVDGVYIASTAGGIMSLSNVERVEVLYGPQGTLFGRNSTGGLINIVTRTPSRDFGGEVAVGYGNYQTITADGYLTAGLGESIAMDVAAHFSDQGEGWGTNQFNGQDVYRLDEDYAVRSSLLGDFGRVQLRLIGDYSWRKGSTNPTNTAPGTFPTGNRARSFTNPWDVAIDTIPVLRVESYGGSAKADVDVGFGTVSSITAWRESKSLISIDGDTTVLATNEIYLNQFDEQLSQELQLASNEASPIDWIVGFHYFDVDSGYAPSRVRFTPPFNRVLPGGLRVAEARNRPILTSRAISGYAQATFPFGEASNLTTGFRHTSERRTLELTGENDILNGAARVPVTPVALREVNVTEPTWRIAVDHRFTPGLLGYVSYNKGFKSGGFNANAPTDVPYRPETLNAYELGLKSDWLDRRLRLNGAVFWYDYADIHLARFIGGANLIYNGGGARSYGLDLSFEAQPVEGLSLNGGIAFLNAKFTDAPGLFFYNPNPNPPFGNVITNRNGNGNTLPFSPDAVATLSGRYAIPTTFGTVVLDAGYYRSTSYFTNADNVLRQPAFDLVNAGVALELRNGLEFRLAGQNLGDEAVSGARNCSPSSCAITYRPPRTYGASVRMSF